MKYGNGYKGCDVKPDGNIEMTFSSFDDGHEHVQAKYHPDQGDGNINGPFKFCIFLTGRHAQWNGDGCSNNDQLPSPEMDFSQQVTGHACLEQPLNRIIVAHENTISNKGENDGIGVQGPEPAEGEANRFFSHRDTADIEFREHHEQCYPYTNEHTDDAPDDSGKGEISDDPVVVRELFNVHIRGFGCLKGKGYSGGRQKACAPMEMYHHPIVHGTLTR